MLTRILAVLKTLWGKPTGLRFKEQAVTRHHAGFLLHEKMRLNGFTLVRLCAARPTAASLISLSPVLVKGSAVFNFKISRTGVDSWELALAKNEALTTLLADTPESVLLTEIASMDAALRADKIATSYP